MTSGEGPKPSAGGDGAASKDDPTTEEVTSTSSSGTKARTRPPAGLTGNRVRLGGAVAILVVVSLVLLAIGFCLGRLYEVPGPLEFWKVTAQPLGVVTAGLLAVSAAVVTFIAYRLTSDSASASATLQRDKEVRAEALDRCWERFRFIFDNSETGGDDDPELPPEVIFEVVILLAEEAKTLKDQVLVQFIAQWGSFYADAHLPTPAAPADQS